MSHKTLRTFWTVQQIAEFGIRHLYTYSTVQWTETDTISRALCVYVSDVQYVYKCMYAFMCMYVYVCAVCIRVCFRHHTYKILCLLTNEPNEEDKDHSSEG